MRENDGREQALRRVLWLLRDHLPQLVVVGGWVPQLHRAHGGFASWQSRLSGTGELDVLIASTIDLAGRPPLAALLRDAGFSDSAETRGAVWTNAPATGEKIEFFVPHTGMASSVGKIRSLRGQSGMAAIQLTDLELMHAHTRDLLLPIAIASRSPVTLTVRVPTLGAYLVAKASTFLKRPAGGPDLPHARRAKDLVYIRDVMAAGPEVVTQVEHDLADVARAGDAGRRGIEYAANSLRLVNDMSGALEDAALELAERDGLLIDDARRSVTGFLGDLREILEAVSDVPDRG